MGKIQFDKAYYIKLGARGVWEEDSINSGKIRIGWGDTQLEDIQKGNWDKIKKEIQEDFRGRNKASGSAQDFNALKNIYDADSNTVFVTFHKSKLWWCRVGDEVGKDRIKEDGTSKYREVDGKWSDQDTDRKVLLSNQIPGNLSKLQRYPATCCMVWEVDHLRRLINAEHSPEYKSISDAKKELQSRVEAGIKLLHWKDFEILVDLVFRQAGWRRVSVLGETMKFFDLVLEEPITNDRYGVQIKAETSRKEFEDYAERFTNGEFDKFRRLYFVVHSTDDGKSSGDHSDWDKGYEKVELIFADELAKIVVDGGLVDWLMEKIQ
jgi:hypothetical protein